MAHLRLLDQACAGVKGISANSSGCEVERNENDKDGSKIDAGDANYLCHGLHREHHEGSDIGVRTKINSRIR